MIAAALMLLASRLGLAGRAQRLAAGAMALAAAIGLLALLWGGWRLWLSSHDRAVVTIDRAAGEGALRNDQVAAERAAGAGLRERAAEQANRQDRLREAADAPMDDDNRSALDAVYDQLREHPAAPPDRHRP